MCYRRVKDQPPLRQVCVHGRCYKKNKIQSNHILKILETQEKTQKVLGFLELVLDLSVCPTWVVVQYSGCSQMKPMKLPLAWL